MVCRLAFFACVVVLGGQVSAEPPKTALDIALPTANDAIYRNDGPGFYQHIDRDYKGAKSTPWEGGQYGFVRDPIETAKGLVYTRFHEGIDIRPLNRDANGEPTDEIHAIAAGKVVHVNPVPGYSNYGRYIVIEHEWGGSNYYSLYGHLSAARVSPGQNVAKGAVIGVMGHTGAGLNRERSHVHLELNLMLSHHFEAWYEKYSKTDPNHNGIYNGINLTGINTARLYLALQKDSGLTIPKFLEGEEVFFKVTVPKSKNFELARAYPWMLRGDVNDSDPSWEVSFERSGVPLQVRSSNVAVSEPTLTFIKKSTIDYRYLTRGQITGRNGRGLFTKAGRQMMDLLSFRP
jgi:murein DD-endopeptidase MepM/ murein hydrolase activator NlpD